jgi:putative membrane protein
LVYLWVKIVHVLAVISWMAGLLYLPRLFVYHSTVSIGSATSQTFKVMERRLLKAIMTPAMLVAWIAGLWMAFSSGAVGEGWFHAKLLAVLILSGTHGMMAVQVKRFGRDENRHSSKYYRIFNEIPTLLMIAAVTLVILKPF